MKVKTFCFGLANGYTASFKGLDEEIKKLGNIKITSLTDTFYPKTGRTAASSFDDHVVRVVVYE